MQGGKFWPRLAIKYIGRLAACLAGLEQLVQQAFLGAACQQA
jgi:hypothetical protein